MPTPLERTIHSAPLNRIGGRGLGPQPEPAQENCNGKATFAPARVFVTVLPAAELGGLPLFVIAWKQQSNGTTFVASPVRLPWLEVEDNEWLAPDT